LKLEFYDEQNIR